MYKRLSKMIVIDDLTDFNILHILECGQIFRYSIDGENAVIYSKDIKIEVKKVEDTVQIISNDLDYAENFFDLKTNYKKIKNFLNSFEILSSAIKFGYGIRILNNDLFEMIVEFIISANNNIPRIKKSIEYLCEHFGKNLGDYYAFPSLLDLKKASVEDYKKAGLGYRAEQLFDTINKLSQTDLDAFYEKSNDNKRKFLLSLKGIGPKVCNCIMLFACHDTESFPVDTWIKKVYNDITKENENNAKIIERKLKDMFKDYSGYAQQYFFYYYRENFKG